MMFYFKKLPDFPSYINYSLLIHVYHYIQKIPQFSRQYIVLLLYVFHYVHLNGPFLKLLSHIKLVRGAKKVGNCLYTIVTAGQATFLTSVTCLYS